MRTHFASTIVRLGHRAEDSLNHGTAGRVAVVFAKSFYLETESRIFACFGPLSFGLGPLNCVCILPDWLDFRASGLREKLPFYVSDNLVRLGERFKFSLEGADTWRPPNLTAAVPPRNLGRNLEALVSTARGRLPTTGLGFLIAGDHVHPDKYPLVLYANRAVSQLIDWLGLALDFGAPQLPPPPGEAVPLIGLGPGLTPSGDDLIGGMMIALRFFERSDVAETLAQWALPLARKRSNAISVAHLEAAAKGEGAQGLHDVLVRLVSRKNRDVITCLEAIDNIGHTSGWDSLAGLVVACSFIADYRSR